MTALLAHSLLGPFRHRPAAEPAPVEVRLGQLARTARRLAEELRVCRGVPASVRTQADDLAAAVESLAVERV